jgi:hypothetical protein
MLTGPTKVMKTLEIQITGRLRSRLGTEGVLPNRDRKGAIHNTVLSC